MLIAVGRYEPRSPSGARISVIAGTRACAPMSPADREHQVPDQAADGDRDERGGKGERRHEDRPRDDDEQRDAEVAPEEREVEAAEHAQPLGNGSMPQDVSFSLTAELYRLPGRPEVGLRRRPRGEILAHCASAVSTTSASRTSPLASTRASGRPRRCRARSSAARRPISRSTARTRIGKTCRGIRQPLQRGALHAGPDRRSSRSRRSPVPRRRPRHSLESHPSSVHEAHHQDRADRSARSRREPLLPRALSLCQKSLNATRPRPAEEPLRSARSGSASARRRSALHRPDRWRPPRSGPIPAFLSASTGIVTWFLLVTRVRPFAIPLL